MKKRKSLALPVIKPRLFGHKTSGLFAMPTELTKPRMYTMPMRVHSKKRRLIIRRGQSTKHEAREDGHVGKLRRGKENGRKHEERKRVNEF
jgi:hypothetical protein